MPFDPSQPRDDHGMWTVGMHLQAAKDLRAQAAAHGNNALGNVACSQADEHAAKAAAKAFQDNPSVSKAQLTIATSHSLPGGSLAKFHPGPVVVYRAGSVSGSGGKSFSTSFKQAQSHIAVGGSSKITRLELRVTDPALSINKLNPNSRYSHEKEVFVDVRGIDSHRLSAV